MITVGLDLSLTSTGVARLDPDGRYDNKEETT